MKKINIIVREEVVRCLTCKRIKKFIYLSDFKYGERLLFTSSGIACAYINFVEDKTYNEYAELVEKILKEKSIKYDGNEVNKTIRDTFGITCDEVNGHTVDFSQSQKVCSYCGATKFERNMIEPESLIKIEISLISHEKWGTLSFEEKEKLVYEELMIKFDA